MKGLTFENFIAHDTNQAAFELCAKVAAPDAEFPRPIVILGEQGAGKSHLLWAIVNHFRASNAQVGVALISAKDFPKKVKRLADNQEQLEAGRPIYLLVDDLHLFEKDMEVLERVLFAVHEHGHAVVVATSIHPNVLPSLSGKLKAFLNNGAIVGIKALPKSEGAVIPEAALAQIAKLKARVAELENGSDAAPVADAPPRSDEDNALVAQLEQIRQERDASRVALERSEAELLELRDNIQQRSEERDAALSETQGLQQSLSLLMERLDKQRTAFAERIAAIETESDALIEMARQLETETDASGAGADVENEELAATEFNLSKAHQQLAIQTAEIDELRAASTQLAEALQRQEAEVRRVVEGVRETLATLEATSSDVDRQTPVEARQALQTIAEQIDALECDMPGAGNGDAELFGDGKEIQTVDDIVSREDHAFPDQDDSNAEDARGEEGDSVPPDQQDAPAAEENV